MGCSFEGDVLVGKGVGIDGRGGSVGRKGIGVGSVGVSGAPMAAKHTSAVPKEGIGEHGVTPVGSTVVCARGFPVITDQP